MNVTVKVQYWPKALVNKYFADAVFEGKYFDARGDSEVDVLATLKNKLVRYKGSIDAEYPKEFILEI